MRGKGSRFTLGVWGWGCVRQTLRNRSQPFATVRNRCPYGCSWRFQMSRSLVSRGRRGTSWHPDVFRNVWKVVLCGRRNAFAKFSEDAFYFLWQAQHFGDHHRHFAWQAQHFRRVLWLVFCESHCQGCVKWWHGANSLAGVAFCEMCRKLTEASHEASILRLQIFRF